MQQTSFFSRDPFGPCVTTDLRRVELSSCSLMKVPRNGLDIHSAHALFNQAKIAVIAWYENTYGEHFNPFSLGDKLQEVREQFFKTKEFSLGLKTLGIFEIVMAHPQYLNLPWWSEVGLAERSWQYDGTSLRIEMTERHSVETQLVRRGIDRGIKPIVITGIVRTLPDGDSPTGYIVCGIRGGSHFRNVIMLPGGALKDTDELSAGESLVRWFIDTELKEELGLEQKHIVRQKLHSRHDDHLLDGIAAVYTFDCQTNLTHEQIRALWAANRHPDKQEHQDLLMVRADTDSLRNFVASTYRGNLLNNPLRPDSDRFLSHHGALPLALEAGISLAELRSLCAPMPV
jgi:hypothetical protein